LNAILIEAPMEESPPPATRRKPCVSPQTLEDLTDVFKLLSDRHRLSIVLALAQDGPMHVTAIVNMLAPQTQPAVSHHLALMRRAGLLACDRNGKRNYYSLASSHLRQLFEQFFRDRGDRRQALQFDDFTLSFSRRDP